MSGEASNHCEGPSNPVEGIRLAVIHWFPLEQYPPVRNLLNYFADQSEFCVLACSTAYAAGRSEYANERVKVVRWKFPASTLIKSYRHFQFILFPFFVFWQLIVFRPNTLLYFEPHSSFPAFLYLLLARRCRLFIHNHEFRDQEEYRHPGNRLMALCHWIERRCLYHRAEWISQTNDDRVRMFIEDYPAVVRAKIRSLPNLPPRTWFAATESLDPCRLLTSEGSTSTKTLHLSETAISLGSRQTNQQISDERKPLKLVYVGAISFRDTFIRPLVEWICHHAEMGIELDLFAGSIDEDTRHYLAGMLDKRIRFVPKGFEYDRLPELLPLYDVGLILYRGNTRNYIFNAPNKLFEYLACGLDVWYPRQMLGVKPHARKDVAPRVIEMDFERLDELPLSQLRSRSGLRFEPFSRRCEDVLSELKQAMTEAVRSC